MPQSKHEIQGILASAGTEPRKRFGQNFMIDQNLVRVVADAGEIRAGDTVIEVGPGTGTLTDELLLRGARVIAVEIDRELAKSLQARFSANDRLVLIEGDALDGKHALNPDLWWACHVSGKQGTVKLVANLPYNIASPLVIELLLAGVELLAFTVQKEVADRLRAAAGSESYGPLSVIVQLLAQVEVLRTLPPQAFWPAPKVESALVRLRRRDELGARAREFSRFVHKLFAARRKTLRKSLALAGFEAADVLRAQGLDAQLRPEMLTPLQLLKLHDALRPSAEA